MIIECKAPEEALNEKVFEQIARYNLSLKVDYLWVTNGTPNYVSRLKGGLNTVGGSARVGGFQAGIKRIVSVGFFSLTLNYVNN